MKKTPDAVLNDVVRIADGHHVAHVDPQVVTLSVRPMGECYRLISSPGDGTRYDLTITRDPHGGYFVIWSDMRAFWWASAHKGGEVELRASGADRHRRERGKPSGGARYDTAVVKALLDAVLR